MFTIISGFTISISLIASIGAQNAFLLKQGLKKQHVLPLILSYVISDIFLVSAGVFGFAFAKEMPKLMLFLKWSGIIFLVSYGVKSLYSAFTVKEGLTPHSISKSSLKKTLLVFLAFTWLNPQVYLDTIVLIGGISTQFHPNELLFWFGSVSASIIYACFLGYGARIMAPLFAKAISWKILDTLIAFIMFILAWHIYNN